MLKFVTLALVLCALTALKVDTDPSEPQPLGVPGGICPTSICHSGQNGN